MIFSAGVGNINSFLREEKNQKSLTGNASHDCPPPGPEAFTHDKRLASSGDRGHRKSKPFSLCRPSSEKSRTAVGGTQILRWTRALCSLLAEFSLRPASHYKLFSLHTFRALSADTRKRPFPERHPQPFGYGLFVSFSPGKKKRTILGKPRRGCLFGGKNAYTFLPKIRIPFYSPVVSTKIPFKISIAAS